MRKGEQDAAQLVETMLRLGDHSPASSFPLSPYDKGKIPGEVSPTVELPVHNTSCTLIEFILPRWHGAITARSHMETMQQASAQMSFANMRVQGIRMARTAMSEIGLPRAAPAPLEKQAGP